ncbi:AfsR/SARP family transcriptional regulator [Acrocarpospora catenulata]|uniref:AfsR/SARP family transcriptional regulator n=1 Tax=Acrocarpospora catenulata TaxID=2836182 RepID=UPI001BDB6933|nr:tetratricopeptide repeat protein [Acrocarpospora catenulata]
MEFRILGQIQALSENGPIEIGWARERHILAILLLAPGQPVPVKSLISRIWDDDQASNARSQIHQNVARIRKWLPNGGANLRNRAGAYVLDIAEESVDLHRFRMLRARARAVQATGDREQAIRLLREASLLWRGEPLSGLTGSWADRTREVIEEELLSALIERADLELQIGLHADLVGELRDLIVQYPLNERLVEMQMLALYRSGRLAEALAVYRDTQRRFHDELGSETSHKLRELHQRILRSDPTLLPRPRLAAQPPSGLPRDVFNFTGRAEEISQLTAMAAARATAVTVLRVDGMAGVGKSTLALHVAHMLAPRYADGQIYLDLYGHRSENAALDPFDALTRLLRAIGIPGERIPKSLDEGATLWRTELARRRMLIVLDDATGHEQIRHLLPGAPGSLVLITSRRRLAGLDDAPPLTLNPLPHDDAITLLGRIIGPRLSRETEDVAKVVELCGYLPLAIVLAGQQFGGRTSWRVSDVVARLSEKGRRLAELRAENREVIAAFECSYQELDNRHRQTFRSLGLHPSPEITIDCAAALLSEDRATTERLLDGIHDHHLITEPIRGRYCFHDLIWEYARSLAENDPAPQRRAAMARVLDFYLHLADQADRMLPPFRARPHIEIAHVPQVRPEFRSADEAREWLEKEMDNLIHLIRYASADGWARHATLFPHVLSHFLEAGGNWKEATYLHELAISGWRELADQPGLARALAEASKVNWRIGNYEQAIRFATEGLAIRRALNDQSGIAELLDQFGRIYWHRADFETAREYCREALNIRKMLGDHHEEVNSLNHLAILAWHLGDYIQAADQFQEALRVSKEIGDDRGQMITLNNVQEVELRLGRYASARRHLEQAAVLESEMSRQHQATWLANSGNLRRELGEYNSALDFYRKALQIYNELGDRRANSEILNETGFCLGSMNREGESLIHHQHALTGALELSDRYLESKALFGLGEVHRRAHRHNVALEHYRRALGIARDIKDIYQESLILDRMGLSLFHSQERAEAEACWREAATNFDRLGVPEARTTRARLDRSIDTG